MKHIINIINQSFFSFSGRLFAIVFGVLYKFYLVDKLEDPTYALGLLGFVISFISITTSFTSLGFSKAANRFIPLWKTQNNHSHTTDFIKTSVLVSLFTSLILAFLLWVYQDYIISAFSFDTQTSDLKKFLIWFLILMVSKNLLDVFQSIIVAAKEVKTNVSFGVFFNLGLKFTLVLALLYLGYDLKGYIFGETIAIFITSIIFLYLVVTKIPTKGILSFPKTTFINKEFRSYTLSMLLLAILAILSGNMDKILLAKLSINDLGVYTMTLLFTPFIGMILYSVNSIFAPIISEIFSNGELKKLDELYQFFTKWTLLLTTPLFIFLMSFRNEVLLFFGKDFVVGSSALAVLIIGQMISVGFGSIGIILQMTGKHVKVLKIYFLQTLIVLVLMFVLIPKYGIIGAAISSSVGVLLSNLFNYSIIYKAYKLVPYKKETVRIFTTLIISYLLSYFIYHFIAKEVTFISFFLNFMIAVVVTLTFSRILCFSPEDKSVFQRIFTKK